MTDEDTKQWIYAGGLPYELTEGDVICVFSQYGEIVQFTLARDKETGKSRGFGFLKYEDHRSCELAVDNFNGATIIGRRIKVSYANNTSAIKATKPTNVEPREDSTMPIVESATIDRRVKDMERSTDRSPELKRRHKSRSRSGSRERRDHDRRTRYIKEEYEYKSKSNRHHDRDHSPPRRRDKESYSTSQRHRSPSSSPELRRSHHRLRHEHRQSKHNANNDSERKDSRHRHKHSRQSSRKYSPDRDHRQSRGSPSRDRSHRSHHENK